MHLLRIQYHLTLEWLSNSHRLIQWNTPSNELSWQNMSGSTNNVRYNDVDIVNAHQGWAVGHASGGRFSYNRLNNGVWTSVRITSAANRNLFGTSMVSNQEAWAVGARSGANYTLTLWQGGANTNWCIVQSGNLMKPNGLPQSMFSIEGNVFSLHTGYQRVPTVLPG